MVCVGEFWDYSRGDKQRNYFMVLNPYLRFRITITIITREMKRVTESHGTCWLGAGLHIQSVWPQRPPNYPAHSLS